MLSSTSVTSSLLNFLTISSFPTRCPRNQHSFKCKLDNYAVIPKLTTIISSFSPSVYTFYVRQPRPKAHFFLLKM